MLYFELCLHFAVVRCCFEGLVVLCGLVCFVGGVRLGYEFVGLTVVVSFSCW